MKHNPGDNLLIGRIKIALSSVGSPMHEQHLAARAKYTLERTRAALNRLRDDGIVEYVGDGRWTI